MIKNLLFLGSLAVGSLFISSTGALAQHRGCGTHSHQEIYNNGTPEIRNRMDAIEQHTQAFEQKRDKATGVITIPVVVHVVYNTAAQNITDAMIQSQIDVLNKDFRKTNPDASQVPSLFAPVAADLEIQFQLATKDPNGNPTNGITRTSTTRTFFEYGGGDANGVFVKQTAQGGKDAWNTTQYLNMWVCNFGGASVDLLGYATFPTDAGTFKDGVVMGYKFFGVNPSLGGVFGYGRTATHEVGHWLNLRHIWGDANCGNDLVSDTPTQQTSNGGCPTFPKKTCSNTSDMFMNYMDYVNDQCMFMFSAGQKARARALFDAGGARISLLTSPALGGGTTTCPTSLSTPAGLTSSAVATTTANIAWSAVTGATSYSVQFRPTGTTTWSSGTSASTSASLSGLTAGTTYEFQVRATCSAVNSAFSASATFTTTTTTVAYCASKGNSVADEWIDLVQIGTINRTSAGNAGYFNGTASSTNVTRGASTTISYSAGFRSGYTATEFWAIYVDWNRDGDFLDAGETVATRSSASAATLSSTFTVPATASLGATRIRVSMKYNAAQTSCEAFSYGEVEDYTLNVVTGLRESSVEVPTFKTSLNTSIYPNPTSDEAKISVENFDNANLGKIQISLTDASGKAMQNITTENIESVQYEGTLDVRGYKAGIYFVTVVTNGEKQVKRLVIQ